MVVCQPTHRGEPHPHRAERTEETLPFGGRPMSHRGRLVLFALGAAGLAATLGAGFAAMPSFGGPISAYAALLNHLAPLQRRVTDVVSAVTFDYRGIDTLFEEFILFSAVSGIAVLLRPLAARPGETATRPEDAAPERRIPPPSPAVGLL